MSVPLFQRKYESDAFFAPADLVGYMRKVGRLEEHKAPEAVIFSYQGSLLDHAERTMVLTPAKGYFGGHLSYLEETGGRVAIAARFGIGSPAAAVMLEELIAWGVRRFVSVGTAGSLVADLPPGSLLLCDGALRDEGTSYHYLPGREEARPSAALTDRLGAELDARGLVHRRGSTWTTDAIYRETAAEVEYFRGRGALVVEMEAAALFAVAAYRGVELAACFSVSDTLAELAWRPEFHAETTEEGLDRIFEAALHAVLP
jgi:uridine phosphorylase